MGPDWTVVNRRPEPDPEAPAHRVRLDAFLLDATEVTNGQFEAFVKSTGYRTMAERIEAPDAAVRCPSAGPGATWTHPFGADGEKARPGFPIIMVTWDDAMAYAAWRGVRLPTEAEWEYAAWLGSGGQRYPWGDIEPQFACGQFGVGALPRCRRDLHAADGSLPNKIGLIGLGDNVSEWCLDEYLPSAYRVLPTDNPVYRGSGPARVARGGDWEMLWHPAVVSG